MGSCARDVMRKDVRVVGPDATFADLDRDFLEHSAPAFPVVADGKLVGIVSRSDVVRQIFVEQTRAESLFLRSPDLRDPEAASAAIARQVGERIESLTARDLMMGHVVTASPDTPVGELARRMVEHSIHEIVVVDGDAVVGVVASLDLLARLAAR